jgi:hypothetical protein
MAFTTCLSSMTIVENERTYWESSPMYTIASVHPSLMSTAKGDIGEEHRNRPTFER